MKSNKTNHPNKKKKMRMTEEIAVEYEDRNPIDNFNKELKGDKKTDVKLNNNLNRKEIDQITSENQLR